MNTATLLIAVAIVGGVGLLFGALIAIAHRKLWVYEDPRIDAVAGMLPGANCGACGFPGCRGFAEAAVNGQIAPAKCTVANDEARSDIASYLGVDAGQAEKRVAHPPSAARIVSHLANRSDSVVLNQETILLHQAKKARPKD